MRMTGVAEFLSAETAEFAKSALERNASVKFESPVAFEIISEEGSSFKDPQPPYQGYMPPQYPVSYPPPQTNNMYRGDGPISQGMNSGMMPPGMSVPVSDPNSFQNQPSQMSHSMMPPQVMNMNFPGSQGFQPMAQDFQYHHAQAPSFVMDQSSGFLGNVKRLSH